MPETETELDLKAVHYLRETVEAVVGRLDQELKTQQEVTEALRQATLALKEAEDATRTATEALRQALGDLDKTTDDLATISSAQMAIKVKMDTLLQEQQQGG